MRGVLCASIVLAAACGSAEPVGPVTPVVPSVDGLNGTWTYSGTIITQAGQVAGQCDLVVGRGCVTDTTSVATVSGSLVISGASSQGQAGAKVVRTLTGTLYTVPSGGSALTCTGKPIACWMTMDAAALSTGADTVIAGIGDVLIDGQVTGHSLRVVVVARTANGTIRSFALEPSVATGNGGVCNPKAFFSLCKAP